MTETPDKLVEPSHAPPLQEFFRFPFREGQLGRFLIGSCMIFAGMVIPIVPMIFVYGYVAQIMRSVIAGESPAMPPWEDWERIAVDGLKLLGVHLIYMTPGLLILIISGMISSFWPFFIPIFFRHGNMGNLFLLIFGSTVVLSLLSAIGMILIFLALIPLPGALAHVIGEEAFGAAFRFRQLWRLFRNNPWGYLVTWTLVLGVGGLTSVFAMLPFFTIVLCWVWPFIIVATSFYIVAVAGAVFSRTYYESLAADGETNVA